MLGAYEHQEMTYGSLLQALRLSRDPSRAPIIPVLFNLDRAQTGFHLGELKSEVEEVSAPRWSSISSSTSWIKAPN